MMLRGDPVFISPVRVFGLEYQSDIGWPGRPLLYILSPGLRRHWKFFEIFSVYGTISLAVFELFLLLHNLFLYVGVPAMIVWGIWLVSNEVYWTGRLTENLARNI